MAATQLTVAQVTTHAQNFCKSNSNLLSAEELRIAQTVNNEVNGYYQWRWGITAGTNIAIASGTQEYNLAAGDTGRVRSLNEAWLLSGATDQFPLMIADDPPVYTTDTTGQPFAVSLITDARLRLFPTPDATYTLSFRYQNAGTAFTANTETYDAPYRFDGAVKAGVIWQFLEFMDDQRAPLWKATFYEQLERLKRIEMKRLHITKG